ncbi:MAG: pyridoxal phosphate-dependent aminotransferase [Tissierellia bacterium]|nr:pyridoxal phosphate-dependent aminotransferase [Tissierellia bacterium]
MRFINDRFKGMSFGGLYEIFAKATELEKTGKKLVHMEIGRPDFISPQIAIEESKKALDQGHVHYTPVQGIPELRQAIVDKEKRRHGLDYSAEDEIVVTAGACEALASVFFTILEDGDEVIGLGPYFTAYYEQSLICNFKFVEMQLKIEDGWKLDLEELRGLITPRTKAILINSPNNPAGYILSQEELEYIADLAKEHDLMVISDDCYDEFVYEGQAPSIAKIEGMRERTLVVKSTSKSFSMTGWRVAYVMAPSIYIKYINKVHQNLSTCATSFAQYGASYAFNEADEFIDDMVGEFKKRGDFIYQELSKIERLDLVKPQGAFYLFPKITKFGMSEEDFCDYILEEAGVVGVPGSNFGKSGAGHIRLAYCRTMEELEMAAENLKIALDKLE